MILVLNAPPSAGKDTLADRFVELYEYRKASFKSSMFSIATAVSGISEEDWFTRYNDRSLKEEPWDRLGGLSCRQFMIKISEDWIKPVFGKDHFGKVTADMLENDKSYVFSDGGFVEEIYPLAIKFWYDDIFIVRLHRAGCSYEGDSRSYLPDSRMDNVHSVDVDVIEGKVDQTVDQIIHAITEKQGGIKYEQ